MRSALAYALGSFAVLLLWYLGRYGDCTSYFFHFDDFWLLGDAHGVHGLADIVRPGRNHFVLYRPLSQMAYFSALGWLFGGDPAPYHGFQLLAHVFNALLVCGVAAAVLGSRWLGLAAAVIYAAMPGHAIAVYWNALYSMTGTVSWYLACLWLWIRLSRHEPLRTMVAFVLFLGALLSSEHGVTLPVALALGSLLVVGEPWKRTALRLAPFFLVAVVYGLAKIEYMRHGLDADYADPFVRALIRRDYQPVIAPLASLRLLGFYTGCALGWIYDASSEAPRWYAVGTAMLALLGLSAWWAHTSEAGRPVFFGLLLFGTALGPVLLLPGHPYSYYVGTAGAGFAIAIVAAARALPRVGAVAPVVAVALILAGEMLVGEPKVKASEEFRFFREFQVVGLRWLQAVEAAAGGDAHPSVVVVPRNPATELVFEQGQAHHLLLGGTYDVRVVADVAAEPIAADVAVVNRTALWRRGNDYPGRQSRWDWLRRSDPWAKE